jgi:DHA1 family bicyclomycin/chloramphenicol resistance-like MFS transporter
VLSKEWKHLVLIIIIFIAACIETDIYLPAFTDMMAFFSVSEEKIQRILSWNFIGICLSCPFYGPISDAIGRKKPLLYSLGFFLLGSLMTLFASNFDLILIGRFLQGIGCGGCFTLGTAIIFDAFQKEKAIEAVNKLNSIVPFIMAAAPIIGGYLNLAYGFRSNFLVITLCVLASFLISLFFYEETLPPEKRSQLKIRKILRDFKTVSLSIPFWQTTLIVSLPFSGYLVFLSTISVLFVLEYGVDKTVLPIYQIALLGIWIIASLLHKKAINYWGIPQIKKVGMVLILLGGVALAGTAWLDPLNSILLTSAMVCLSFGVNWVQGLYFPEGMELFPDNKGITSSLLTSARLLLTALVVGITGSFYNSTIYPVTLSICLVNGITLLLIFIYESAKRKSVALSNKTV